MAWFDLGLEQDKLGDKILIYIQNEVGRKREVGSETRPVQKKNSWVCL